MGGQISWYNRTVSVAAEVDDWTPEQWVWTYAEFAAFAGDRKISQKGIWAREGTARETFPLGDTNLVGGVNRIRIILCRDSGPHIQPHQNGFFRECGPHGNHHHPW
ncbi:hypothetical protein SAMN05421812_12035 [Asanoa hainanensis]|uniref:Uncharacterized protein n=1 Tax=Asanoa hainanensis TaxID=560556 RepID=A0A239PFE1_9ACTN|nr:hypothetical protein [Asanoa hainanensis]SNT65119.1 hypothetical protein SAMN05421812_12035 [Asanoa hainanensis]